MSIKNQAYYNLLIAKIAKHFKGTAVNAQNKKEYALAVVDTVADFDLNFDLHCNVLMERYGNNVVTLYYPFIAHLSSAQLQDKIAIVATKGKKVPVHVEYFHPGKPSENKDEPLMGLLTLKQYLKYVVNEFCEIADHAIQTGSENDFLNALTSKQGFCFEVAMRCIRNWYNENTPPNKFHDIESLKNGMLAKLDEFLKKEEVSLESLSEYEQRAVLAYFISARAPLVANTTFNIAKIQEHILSDVESDRKCNISS